MKIASRDRKSFLTLSIEEQSMEQFPSRRLAVEADLGGFRGRYDKVWVAQDECRKFLAQVEELDRSRKGSAALDAMSPNEFRLELRMTDSAGHVALATALRIVRYQDHGTQAFAIEGGFDLEPSELPSIVQNLRALLG